MTVNSLLSILLDFQTPRQIYFSKCLIHTYIYVLTHFSRVQLFVTLWAVVFQVPLSMGFSRQEYWSGLPFPSPRNLPSPGIELTFLLHWQLGPLPLASPGKPITHMPRCRAVKRASVWHLDINGQQAVKKRESG